MGSNKEVTHNGIVKSKTTQGIKVAIVVQSGCASCQIKGSCNMAEQTDKELDISCDPLLYRVGQRVEVKLKASQGFSALFLGYLLPFFVLLTTMIIASNITQDEGIVGIAAILSLAPYYLALYFFRNKIKKKFTYVVQPLN
ncbi:MAG: SoxR reducing system RseC family protein [Prolixibacteraceae bacterium]|jgi:sigma-E factor negative regulatory protein RseC|nr:SoxR reducing system RseC family protein [Prolixibacteraceae bacterium]